jgi:hypothetical protein
VIDLDRTIVGLIVALGVLVAVATMGYWPASAVWAPSLVVSVATGLALLALPALAMPSETRWMVPWLVLAGGLSAAVSVRS